MGMAINRKGKIRPRNNPNLCESREISAADFLLKYLDKNITIINFANSEGWKLNHAILNQRWAPERTAPRINTKNKKTRAKEYKRYVQSQSRR
jgi:hypothetical protein